MKLKHKLQRILGAFITGDETKIAVFEIKEKLTDKLLCRCRGESKNGSIFRFYIPHAKYTPISIYPIRTLTIPKRCIRGLHKWQETTTGRGDYSIKCELCGTRCSET